MNFQLYVSGYLENIRRYYEVIDSTVPGEMTLGSCLQGIVLWSEKTKLNANTVAAGAVTVLSLAF